MEGVGGDIKVTVVLKCLINLHILQVESVKEWWGFSALYHCIKGFKYSGMKWNGIEQLYFLGM